VIDGDIERRKRGRLGQIGGVGDGARVGCTAWQEFNNSIIITNAKP